MADKKAAPSRPVDDLGGAREALEKRLSLAFRLDFAKRALSGALARDVRRVDAAHQAAAAKSQQRAADWLPWRVRYWEILDGGATPAEAKAAALAEMAGERLTPDESTFRRQVMNKPRPD